MLNNDQLMLYCSLNMSAMKKKCLFPAHRSSIEEWVNEFKYILVYLCGFNPLIHNVPKWSDSL